MRKPYQSPGSDEKTHPTIWASVKLGDTLGMLIWRETINGILCCFGGNTDK